MRKSRFTEEQIISFIKQGEAGLPIKELCRKGGVSFGGVHHRARHLRQAVKQLSLRRSRVETTAS
jgi:Transposase